MKLFKLAMKFFKWPLRLKDADPALRNGEDLTPPPQVAPSAEPGQVQQGAGEDRDGRSPIQSPAEIGAAAVSAPQGSVDNGSSFLAADPATQPPTHPAECPTVVGLKRTRLEYASTMLGSYLAGQVPPLLYYQAAEKVVRIDSSICGDAENWFFLGDIHGDFYALYNVVEHVKRLCPEFRLVFLGDLVDRGPHPLECLWYLLHLAAMYPHRIVWLAGNHDIGVIFDRAGNCYRSSVSPAEFVDYLNQVDSWAWFRRHMGKEFIELVAGLPRAVLFPDGLLVTHGGFPHTDLHPQLAGCRTAAEKTAWINSDACLQDFTWARITRYRKKIPNRSNTGCGYGFGDFEEFCSVTADFFPARRLVTGHEHPVGGFEIHETWRTLPALTLSGFAFHSDYDNKSAFCDRYQDYLVVGRNRRDELPDVMKIPVDRDDLAGYFSAEIA